MRYLDQSRGVKQRYRQGGAALAVSLIVLLVLTLMVISGGQEVVLQEKMSAAVRDSHLSMQAAERALHDANDKIIVLTGTGGFSDVGTGGFYSKGNGPANLFADGVWDAGKSFTGTMTVAGQDIDYEYFIEETDVIEMDDERFDGVNLTGYGQTTGGGNVTAFKVVARSGGISGNAERMIVAFIGKRL